MRASWKPLIGAALLTVFLPGGVWTSTIPAGFRAPGDVPVTSTPELLAAIDAAVPGDVIRIAPGTYDVDRNVSVEAPGTAEAPITVRADSYGTVLIRFDALEGFKVSAPHWTFENLDIEGVCATDSDCEHAFHVVGAADFFTLRRSRLREFNAAIKGNGQTVAGGGTGFPDDVLIEHNEIFNAAARDTGNPVTPIDVVGGRRWIVRANFIHDFEKGGGNTISYAAFFKGGSTDGLFERNLVICERDHSGGVRVGLSFGGGGTGDPAFCQDGVCKPEHRRGVMRNNIVMNCPDVGVFLNAAADSGIYGNTLFETTGIDVRFPESTADVRDNLLSGAIRERDGGTFTGGSNLSGVTEEEFESWFADPSGADFRLLDGSSFVDLGEWLDALPRDYCDHARDLQPDLGAVEYGQAPFCDTTIPGGGSLSMFVASRTGGRR